MIKAVFYTRNDKIFGLKIDGHAYYGGFFAKDVVCASVSALVINTLNSISKYTKDKLEVKEYRSGLIKFKIDGAISPQSDLLLKSLQLGLTDIYGEYGDKYIRVYFREVKSCLR
ncbi:MAG: ribosomal-processing cysteine protease Prp [Eubacterium sp.]|nr:ribosomal-processing cysteine protease Prp [Eubacterium sp.]